MTSLSLDWERREYGLRLTFPQSVYPTGGADKFAGDINVTRGHPLRWRFTAPDGTQGPIRGALKAAEYDALAYWSDNPYNKG